MATFEFFRRKGKDYYENFFKAEKDEISLDNWISKQPYQTLTLTNKAGLKLTGYHVPKENSDFTFVIIHGYHSRALNMEHWAQAFYENFNCDLFLPDLRSHGESEGNLVGWGIEDKEDIKEWVNLLHQQHPNRPIVLFGVSMGGATVNYLSCEEMPGVKALVEDCGYSTLYEEFDFQSKRVTKLPLAPFYYGMNQQTKANSHYSIKDGDGIECVKHAKYPMMFIHGLDDEVVPCYMVYDLFNACCQEKQLFVVKDAKHGHAIRLERDNYLKLLKEFLDEHLA